MIIGFISYIIDTVVLNIIPYNHYILFPMFTINSVITSIYFRNRLKIVSLLLLMSLSGLFFYSILFYLIIKYYINKDIINFNIRDYLVKITISLIIYDVLLFITYTGGRL